MKRLLASILGVIALSVSAAEAFPPLTTGEITANTIEITGLECDTRYRINVRERQGTKWSPAESVDRTTKVCAAPPAPTSSYTYSPSSPIVGQSVTFTSTSSCQATPCNYVWEDDGPDGAGGTQWPLGTGQQINFTFQTTGTKNVRLNVTDNLDRTSTSVKAIDVSSPPPPTDSDSDGVPDSEDECPTEPGTEPNGCPPTPPPTGTCDLTASPTDFATKVSAATAGQVVCLQTGNYGTWGGTNKAITVRAVSGASPSMKFDFNTGDSQFTVDGVINAGGQILNGANNITVKNSTFNSAIWLRDLRNSNVVFNGNTHLDTNVSGSARVYLPYNGAGSGIVIRNSLFTGGDSDGIEGGVGLNIINNNFIQLCYQGANHTDAIQFYGNATDAVIRGNYVQATCTTQGIVSYDHGTVRALVENNVVDITRPWGIEWGSDQYSIIRHNTIVWRPSSECQYNATCGFITIGAKDEDPDGVGTEVYNNLAFINVESDAHTVRNDHNINSQGAIFVGPTPLDAWADYKLAAGSVGKGAADDGGDVGIR